MTVTTIETERLLLRPYREDDFDALRAILEREDVARYLYSEAMSADEVREALAKRLKRTTFEQDGDSLGLAAVRKDTGELIGDLLLMLISTTHQQGEIGYIFHPGHGGQGFATEGARELLRLGFERYHLHRIVGRLDGRNTASARLLERLGMRREAHLVQNEIVKGAWTDEVIYAMLASEWTG